jgi:predicted HD phosphohydrolase
MVGSGSALSSRCGAAHAPFLPPPRADCGHLIGASDPNAQHMEHCGIVNHEGIGQAFCDEVGLPPRVGLFVRGHVQAKRYLCKRNPAYLAKLSEASATTLRHQGGPMSEEEAAAFEEDPMHKDILRMRTWDEAAKVVGAVVPLMNDYRGMMRALISRELREREARASA